MFECSRRGLGCTASGYTNGAAWVQTEFFFSAPTLGTLRCIKLSSRVSLVLLDRSRRSSVELTTKPHFVP